MANRYVGRASLGQRDTSYQKLLREVEALKEQILELEHDLANERTKFAMLKALVGGL